jgi:hypothetical protein
VLIVDENDADRQRLAEMLRAIFGPDLQVREADEGRRGLEFVERAALDLVFVDYRLPDLSGLEMLIQMGEMASQPAIVLMARQGSERLAADAIKLGAADYLNKREISPEILERIVWQALRAASAQRRKTRMLQRMEHSQREMDHFVRAISHDMNVNLMLLDHSVRDLKRSMGPEQSSIKDIAANFAHVEASLRESRRFLDDLVKLSQSGQMEMTPERVELGPLVREILFEQESLLAERHIDVVVSPDLPAVWCNASRIKQVFTNLIRNAARHGCDANTPRIEIALAPRKSDLQFVDAPQSTEAPHFRRETRRIQEPTADLVAIGVYDNGPGIPPRFRDEIFLPGRRLPGTKAPGTGMGLAIVKRIIEHYGGQIEIDRDCKHGTRFLFTLPIAGAEVRGDGQRPTAALTTEKARAKAGKA